MSTPYEKIYDSFLAKISEDEWCDEAWTTYEVYEDLHTILEGAIPWFKFPRVSLDHDENGFNADLTNDEIQILAVYMKCEWLNRTILTWENIKPLYSERDFSQANLLSKFNETLNNEHKKAKQLEQNYYRSINYKPFNYRKLASQDE